MDRYIFSEIQRKAYEQMNLPIAVYQYINNRIYTLLVSEGLCELTGLTREQITRQFDAEMFGNVHPEDVEMLAKLGQRFATREDKYDIIYRVKLKNREDYSFLHTVGKFQTMEDGSRVAFFMYSEVTEYGDRLSQVFEEYNDPKVKFLDENMGAMVIVSRDSHQLLYYNKAARRILNPKGRYDTGVTFQQFFYPDYPEGIRGLLGHVDFGTKIVEEPRSHRSLDVNMMPTTWDYEPAIVLYFYEHDGSKAADTESILRQKKLAFYNVMFSGGANQLHYYEDGYTAVHVWNLSTDECILEEGDSFIFKNYEECRSFDQYCTEIRKLCTHQRDIQFMDMLNTSSLVQLYESGTYPRSREITIKTEHGHLYISLQLTMMRSPSNGELFVKIWLENHTDEETLKMLITKTVEKEFDYIAYLDLAADKCRIIYGNVADQKKEGSMFRISEFGHTASGLNSLFPGWGSRFRNLSEMTTYMIEQTRDHSEFTNIAENRSHRVKKTSVQSVDEQQNIFCIRCIDVTELIAEEKSKVRELEDARKIALDANQVLSEAVRTEQKKVEKVLIQTVLSINNALDAKDEYTCRHSERVAKYAALIARYLNWADERVQNLYNISLVHDIGKIGVPDAILQKRNTLTFEEYEQIKKHVDIGGTILKDFTAIDKVSEGALYHHERFDGLGYSQGLKGIDIPIEARIIGIADAIDAMNSTRPYRQKQNVQFIIGELWAGRGTQFDPDLVDTVLKLIEDEVLEL